VGYTYFSYGAWGAMPREGVLGQATRIDPVPADHEALDSLRAREDLGGGELVLRTADGTEISLPSSLLRLVVSAASNLAAGRAVITIPAEVMLTPAEAAGLLGLSRPFVARLLERGDIPSELLPESRHRRIRLEDVLAFQDRRERRAEGRRRIAGIAASADLPYLCFLFAARVFIDTNVLFPFSVMDLLLALTEDAIHDVMWSDDLLDEWERVIVRERRRSPDAGRCELSRSRGRAQSDWPDYCWKGACEWWRHHAAARTSVPPVQRPAARQRWTDS
jgi:excisionase family DNA binding protein